MPFVYILKNVHSGKHYTGSCVDLCVRLTRHKNKTASATTSKGNYELLCYSEFPTIEEARQVEKKIKSYKGGNAFKKIIVEWSKITLPT